VVCRLSSVTFVPHAIWQVHMWGPMTHCVRSGLLLPPGEWKRGDIPPFIKLLRCLFCIAAGPLSRNASRYFSDAWQASRQRHAEHLQV